jgi:uncharacterized protein (DUF58 family)
VHLAQRAYVLVMLTAVLAVVGLWSGDAALAGWWRLPAGLLLVGLTFEGLFLRHRPVSAAVRTATHALLGQAQPATVEVSNSCARALQVEYAPVLPGGFDGPLETRRLRVPARATAHDTIELLPVRLGRHAWPALPARVLGPLALAWWSATLPLAGEALVAPDTLHTPRRVRGLNSGARPRPTAGSGSELHQLRSYTRGDPLASIDWKASARSGRLITREFSEDQHLDVLIAIDAGRLSRIRAGRLDRLGLYANLAARLAEIVVQLDDRVALVVYADRVLSRCAPARGVAAVGNLRRALEQLSVRPAESDPTAAAVSIRRLLKQRGLVVLLTDLDDATVATDLARAVRLLAPPHLVLIAGVHSGDILELSRREAREWQDPWVALAAGEHAARAQAQQQLLRRLGAPVVAAPAAQLEEAVFAEYQALRRARKV